MEFIDAKKRCFSIPGVSFIAFKFKYFYKTLAAAAVDHSLNKYINIVKLDP
jgi:hypothetical protein